MSYIKTVPGGWIIDVKQPCYICEKLLCCFCEALQDLEGADYKILLFLGYQVVAGTNYKLLCKQTLITNPPTEHLVIVEIFRSLSGECTVTSVQTII